MCIMILSFGVRLGVLLYAHYYPKYIWATSTLSISGLHLLSGMFPRNEVSYNLIRLHSEKNRNV